MKKRFNTENSYSTSWRSERYKARNKTNYARNKKHKWLTDLNEKGETEVKNRNIKYHRNDWKWEEWRQYGEKKLEDIYGR